MCATPHSFTEWSRNPRPVISDFISLSHDYDLIGIYATPTYCTSNPWHMSTTMTNNPQTYLHIRIIFYWYILYKPRSRSITVIVNSAPFNNPIVTLQISYPVRRGND